MVYCGNQSRWLFALDAESGLENWNYHTRTGGTWSSPALSDGVVYCRNLNGYVYALDSKSGRQKWRFETGYYVTYGNAPDAERDWVHSSPAIADGVVYFGSSDGYLYAVK